MSILLGHSSIRPLTNTLKKVNMICEKEMLGFALLSKKGFLRATDSLFLSFLDTKIISIGTIPQSEIEKAFLSKTLPLHATTINMWIRGNTMPPGGLWQSTIPLGESTAELFRASVTNSDEEAVLFIRKGGDQNRPGQSLPLLFTEISEEISEILLDSIDHETILDVLSDPFWEESESPSPPRVFLWNTPKWQNNAFLIQVSTRTLIDNQTPITTAISSIIPDQVMKSISTPGTRSFFIKESDQGSIHMTIPLLRETSHLGWIIQELTLEEQKKTDIAQHIRQKAKDLTQKIFRNREELRLINLLNRDQDSGLLSRRGLIDGLTDLLEMSPTKPQGVGLVGITISDARGIFPLVEHLEIFTRYSDLLGRISPMEFLVLLPDTSRSGTEKALARMKSSLLAEVAQNPSLLANLTFCHAPEDGASPLKLLRSAFQEVPQAKIDTRTQNPFG